MSVWVILVAGMIGVPAMAASACGGSMAVRDPGLHMQWTVERDCDHPERPAQLIEVPWTVKAVVAPSGKVKGEPVEKQAPEVRSGMIVTLGRGSDFAEVHLHGSALGTARIGEKVRVRAGLGAAVLEGIVRGPGLVELLPRKGGN